MPEGGCACGKVRYSYTGEPQLKALCHCLDCRKITGTAFSTNIAIDSNGVKVTSGTPKQWTKTADSGNTITSHFCGDCGSTLFRTGATFGPNTIIKVGTLDDNNAMDNAKPAVELFAPARVSWVSGVSGTENLNAMPGA